MTPGDPHNLGTCTTRPKTGKKTRQKPGETPQDRPVDFNGD
jgi:hypothetical protein